MSVVTGVVLMFSLPEEDKRSGYQCVADINDWLRERGKEPLGDLNAAMGGTKHPEIEVFGGGYHALQDDEFMAFIRDYDWLYPDSVLLVLSTQYSGMRVTSPARVTREETVEWRLNNR